MIKVYVVYLYNELYFFDPYEVMPIILLGVYRDKDDATRNAREQKAFWGETQQL